MICVCSAPIPHGHATSFVGCGYMAVEILLVEGGSDDYVPAFSIAFIDHDEGTRTGGTGVLEAGGDKTLTSGSVFQTQDLLL